MPYHDVTLTLNNDLPVWPGDPKVSITQATFISKGDTCNISHFNSSVHAGTHVDAPYHFIEGAQTVEYLDINKLIGRVFVVKLDDEIKTISGDVLEAANIPVGIKRLMIKTSNSKLWADENNDFFHEFVAITKDGADWIVKRKILLVGVDYLSVAPFGEGVPTHRVLLKAGVIALEGLNLSKIEQGYYEMICLPLKLQGSDGSPARVILRN